MHYQFDWSVVLDPRIWGVALVTTLEYGIGTIIAGLILGVICGCILLLPRSWATAPVNGYVQFIRCTPILVQIVWFYYALPMVLGLDLEAWLASGIGLTLYMGAFSTEIFRAGVISIDRGQWNAS